MADEQLVRRLKALAHPVRFGMLERLAREPEICACDLGDAFADCGSVFFDWIVGVVLR